MTRFLLHVPVIHMDADAGSAAGVMDRHSEKICGIERWRRHKQVVAGFWDALEEYFTTVDARELCIYQDGMIVDGDPARKIVEEAAAQGSRNYAILRDLMERGAVIRKTEDPGLLRQEYERILRLAHMKSQWERSTTHLGYEVQRDELLEKRDRFIAHTINQTLREGERGVLFIGAYHETIPLLAEDLVVTGLKSAGKVRDYFRILVSGGDPVLFRELADYMVRRLL